MLTKGITGFGTIPPLTMEDVKGILKNIQYPYTCTNIVAPQTSNNYYCIDVCDKRNEHYFKLLINSCFRIVAGITAESEWMNLDFINLPNDLIEQISGSDTVIMDKRKLQAKVPKEELALLDKTEMEQVKYWQSKTYGAIIFNCYD